MTYEFAPDSIAAADADIDMSVPWDADVQATAALVAQAQVTPAKKRVTDMFYAQGESMFSVDGPAALSHGWSVFPQEISGRMPGKVGGDTIKWASEHDLKNTPPSPVAMSFWVPHCSTLNTACVFGPASGNAFALDIDVLDKEMSDEISDIVTRILGPTPFRREGRAPKVALLYRHGPGENDKVASASKRFLTIDEDGNAVAGEHALEILGAGKLITFFGRHHTTGQYFKWAEASPMRASPELAPLVTPAQVREFMDAVAAVFPFVTGSTRSGTYGDVSVPVDAEGRDVEGREGTLSRLVFQAVNGSRAALQGVASRPATLAALKSEILQGVVDAFSKRCATDGRWSPDNLVREAGSRVDRTVDKLLAGRLEVRSGLVRRAGDVEVVVHEDELPPPAPATNMSVIVVEPGQIERIVDEAEAALIASGRGIYQRGGDIVGVGTTKLLTWDEQDVSTYRIVSKDEYSLGEDMSASAQWLRYDARAKRRVVIDVPVLAIRTLRSRGKLHLPVLNGFLSAPTLRPDGSIVQEPGYDARTTLLLDLKTAFPCVPENPSKEDAAAALAMLRQTIATFPFASGLGGVDESVVLSAMLTAVIRRSLAFAPIFGFTAPTPGTGKSKLVDMVSALMCGTRAGVISQGRTEEEDEKRLSTAVLAATGHIAVDNATIPVGGAFLDQLMTQETVCPRILGQSRAPACSTSVLVTYNGNNLVITQDSIRRTLLCTLDARCERPQDRAFDSDPVEDVMHDRARLVVAALTILRAFHVAGRPHQGVVDLGSFVQWSRWVRNSLLWLGMPDPVLTQQTQAASDPAAEMLASFLLQWQQVLGTGTFLVRELIDAATKVKALPGTYAATELLNPDFHETLVGIAGQGNSISGKRLAKWMGSKMNQRHSGLHFIQSGSRQGTAVWKLIQE